MLISLKILPKKPCILLLILIISNLFVFGQILNPPAVRLKASDIENKSISDIWLLKNSIYAKHGMAFKTYELHAFFMKQKWYKPNKNYKSSLLTPIDTFNIAILNNKEKQLKSLDYKYISENQIVNFENIYNTFQFPLFSQSEKDKLQQNGFIVYPTTRNQLFHIYENNDYLGVPSFITVDAVLQLYHLYFDKTLKHIESNFLTNSLKVLLNESIIELNRQRGLTTNIKIIKAIDFNLAYLGVSQNLLEENDKKIYGDLSDVAIDEIKSCKDASDYQESKLLDRIYDYSQFIPRGHYTRSEELKRYFLSMMWLGNAGINLSDQKKDSLNSINEINLLASIIFTNVLYNKEYQGKRLIKLWSDIYEPTAFYVGLSDDIGPLQMKVLIDELFPYSNKLDDFDNEEKLKTLVNKLPSGVITGKGEYAQKGLQFRIMGQRFIPDSYLFQRLTSVERPMPNGLEIMAGFGNVKAYELMTNDYKSTWNPSFPGYVDTLKRIISEFNNKPEDYWKQNLYYNWLYNLKSLFDVKEAVNLPFFMTTNAWSVKSLNSAMASWSELRHNTILYAKQSEVAECGGYGGTPLNIWLPEPPKGYVEPNIEFYNRMVSLLQTTTSGLVARGIIDESFKAISSEFMDMLLFLKNVSEKQLKKQKITLEEYEQIQKFGSLLENLTLQIVSDDYVHSWDDVIGPDKNIPVIADVHRGKNEVLEVAVGKAHSIYAIVEIEGKLKLVRGAIFSYYEFPWNSSDRLTDEKWQEMLNKGLAPNQPKWINYKLNDLPEKKFVPLYKPSRRDIDEWSNEPGWRIIYYDTGC
jgi:hypothetical protein